MFLIRVVFEQFMSSALDQLHHLSAMVGKRDSKVRSTKSVIVHLLVHLSHWVLVSSTVDGMLGISGACFYFFWHFGPFIIFALSLSWCVVSLLSFDLCLFNYSRLWFIFVQRACAASRRGRSSAAVAQRASPDASSSSSCSISSKRVCFCMVIVLLFCFLVWLRWRTLLWVFWAADLGEWTFWSPTYLWQRCRSVFSKCTHFS